MRYRTTPLAAGIIGVIAAHAFAGSVVTVDEDLKLDVGLRVQSLLVVTDKDRDGDGTFESDTDAKVRRGRIRVSADAGKILKGFLQTEVGSNADGAGYDMRLIDAVVIAKIDPLLNIYAGQYMAPASRQNLTGSAALMAIDRPGINYKTLTWGTRSVSAFANSTIAETDAGLRGDFAVRDMGATIFSTADFGDNLHGKCYLGAYDGIQMGTTDDLRLTGRVQLNLFDAESGYFNSSLYHGTKKTVGIGASFDQQTSVAVDEDIGDVDYQFYTVDGFLELPCAGGSLTLEAAYQVLDLDDATKLDHDDDITTATKDATQSQGDGYYVQAGYYVNKWQPWVGYERWESDSDTDTGSYDMYRVGVSYFFKGNSANIKAGFERMESDVAIGTTEEDTVDSFVVGLYTNY